MPRLLLSSVVLSVLGVVSGAARAEPLPPPTPLPVVAPPAAFPPPPPYRVSRYTVWQNYGISSTGRILPRVIDGPYGAYYYADGTPYPAVLMHMRDYMPYARD